MTSAVDNATRVITISLPEDVARVAEEFARDQRVDLSEVLTRAVRGYQLWWAEVEKELNSPIDPHDPSSMSLAQVNDLIHEFRRETRQSA